jgi:hypothetical protein
MHHCLVNPDNPLSDNYPMAIVEFQKVRMNCKVWILRVAILVNGQIIVSVQNYR